MKMFYHYSTNRIHHFGWRRRFEIIYTPRSGYGRIGIGLCRAINGGQNGWRTRWVFIGRPSRGGINFIGW